MLLGVCRRYIQDADEAEDVMQDTFVKIFTGLNSYKGAGSFEGWARRIAVNTALDALRKKKGIYFERNLNLVEATDITGSQYERFDITALMACLNKLPAGYRVIINLFLVEEFSHKEIADRLGIGESTSRSQYARARQALLKLINEETENAKGIESLSRNGK